jgi:hypothetical protein
VEGATGLVVQIIICYKFVLKEINNED